VATLEWTLNILLITEDHSPNNYGITAFLSQFADELARCDDIRVIIATTEKACVKQNANIPIVRIPPVAGATLWRWSPRLLKRLDEVIVQYQIDIIHLHGIWMAVQWAGLRIAKRRCIPCVISVHGMLEPWFWKRSTMWNRYKKQLYFKNILSPALSTNTSIHAITPIEKENLTSWFPGREINVIPNAISVINSPLEATNPEKYFLFLGRLHPIKGVDLLIHAFHQACLGKEWRLVIAGPEENLRYSKRLKSLVADKGYSRQVKFIGPVYGPEKWALIQKAWALIMPSYSEVIGMVNLEAALCGVPSITTYETGLADWSEGGGVLIHPDLQELSNNLIAASEWSPDERSMRGVKSRHLVQQNYSWNSVSQQWRSLYTKLSLKSHLGCS
jgi:glycosyltransferase involved in cell wall biosynthesis